MKRGKLWVEREVRVAAVKGTEAERALIHPNAPGLAVTMHQFGEFDVTHIASGKKIAGAYERCAMAQLVLAQLAQCYDWTESAEGIAAQVKAKGEQPVPFPGSTMIVAGIERPQTINEFVRGVRTWVYGDEFPWQSPEDDPAERAYRLLVGVSEEPQT